MEYVTHLREDGSCQPLNNAVGWCGQKGGFREEKMCVACGYGQYLVDKKKKPSTFCNADGKECRSGGIRTRGLLVPKSLSVPDAQLVHSWVPVHSPPLTCLHFIMRCSLLSTFIFLLLAFFRSAALAFTIARSTPHVPHSSVMYFSVLRYLSQPSQLWCDFSFYNMRSS